MKILVLTHRLPFAPNRGDRVRAYHIVRLLAARANVHVVSLVHDREEEAAGRDAAAAAASRSPPRACRGPRNLALAARSSSPTDTPLTHLLLDSPAMRPSLERVLANWRPDVGAGLLFRRRATQRSKAPLAGIPFVLDMVDVDSAKWKAFAADARLPKSLGLRARSAVPVGVRGARGRGRRSRRTVVNERERDTLLQVSPGRDRARRAERRRRGSVDGAAALRRRKSA